MREIKFRAWNVDDKIMKNWGDCDVEIYPDGVICLDGLEASGVKDDESSWVLLQYTGLKDKNGKEIYEGDILQFPNGKIKGSVEWCDGTFRVIRFINLPAEWLNKTYLNKYNKTHIVIGNIYETPELLTNKN